MADQDVATAWTGFDQDRRQRLLSQMTPEQKTNLRNALQAQGATVPSATTAATATTNPEPKTSVQQAKDFFTNSFQSAKDAIGQGVQAATDKINTYLQPTPNTAENSQKYQILSNTDKAYARTLMAAPGMIGDLLSTAKDVATGKTRPETLINMLDPGNVPQQTISQFQSDYQKDPGLAVQNLLGNTLGLSTVGAVTHGIGEKVDAAVSPKLADLRKGATERFKNTARSVAGAPESRVTQTVSDIANKGAADLEKTRAQNQAATEGTLLDRGKVNEKNAENAQKHAQDVAATFQANQDAAQAHQQNLAEIQRNNAANQAAIDARSGLTDAINQHSEELDRRQQAAEVQAKASNDAQWNALREKVGDTPVNTDHLGAVTESQAHSADIKEQPIIRKIISKSGGDQPTVYDLKGNLVPPDSPDYADMYMLQEGVPPSIAEGAANFNDLHRWYSYLGNKLHGSTFLDGQTYHAYKQIQGAIGDTMKQLAEQQGAGDMLDKARQSHKNYMEAFSNSPNQAHTVATKNLQDVSPEYAAEKLRQDRYNKLGRYDSAIPEISNKIVDMRGRLAALPAERSALGALKPEPEAPAPKPMPAAPERVPFKEPRAQDAFTPPEVDVQKIRQDLIQKRANLWKDTSQYQVRRLMASALGSVIAHAVGAGVAEGGMAGYALAEFSPKGLANIVERPKVMEWLTKPSAEDIQAINTIPNIDRTKIVNAITDEAVNASKSGQKLKLAPAAVAFLGASNAQQIADAGSPPKNRKQALERIPAKMNAGISEGPLNTYANPEDRPAAESLKFNKPFAKSGSYTTALSPDQEGKFQTWVKQNKVPWSDTSDADYDMRGYWKALQSGKAKQEYNKWDHTMHFPDTWKTPYSGTFSRESMYAKDNAPHWEGDKLVTHDGKLIVDETAK